MSDSSSNLAQTPAPPVSWRNRYPPHPCADVFPMIGDDELKALAKDIQQHGLQQPVKLLRVSDQAPCYAVLDGRNRLEALARLGVELPTEPRDAVVTLAGLNCELFEVVPRHTDAAAFVISANIRRRHLTKEQQAELIVSVIEAAQKRSNDSAKVARSFSPERGRKGGSTKDPVITAAVAEAQKLNIGKRTVERAIAKVRGRSPAPRKASPPTKPPATKTPTALPELRLEKTVRNDTETGIAPHLSDQLLVVGQDSPATETKKPPERSSTRSKPFAARTTIKKPTTPPPPSSAKIPTAALKALKDIEQHARDALRRLDPEMELTIVPGLCQLVVQLAKEVQLSAELSARANRPLSKSTSPPL